MIMTNRNTNSIIPLKWVNLFLIFIFCTCSSVYAQTTDEVVDSKAWARYLDLLEEVIDKDGKVGKRYGVEKQKFNWDAVSFPCTGNKADIVMQHFWDNLNLRFEWQEDSTDYFRFEFYSIAEALQNSKVDIDLSLIPESSQSGGKDYAPYKIFYKPQDFKRDLNRDLLSEKQMKLFTYAFDIPRNAYFNFSGYVKVDVPVDISQELIITRNDVGETVKYDNYTWVIEYFDNNKLTLRTKDEVYLDPILSLESKLVFEKTEMRNRFDTEGNTVNEESWNSLRSITGIEWETYLKYKSNPRALKDELQNIHKAKPKKDYLYKVLKFRGPLVDEIRYRQVEYLSWVKGLNLTIGFNEVNNGTSFQFFSLRGIGMEFRVKEGDIAVTLPKKKHVNIPL